MGRGGDLGYGEGHENTALMKGKLITPRPDDKDDPDDGMACLFSALEFKGL